MGRVFPLSFGDVHASDRLMAIPLFPQPRMQVLKVTLQVPSIRFLGDPIHPYRRIRSLPAVSSFEGRHINQMCQ